ncbi:MAG: hypothetical protein HYW79_03895 [Parcubacteria group bacterium]|nr:hypothetical protein [Parcubacteria group bacterium]
MKFLFDLLASISSLFVLQANKPENIHVPPLNTAIISFQDTYYASAVADPDNFPKTNSVTIVKKSTPVVVPPPVAQPTPPPPPPPPPAPVVVLPPEDPYVVKTEPIITWLNTNFGFTGTSSEGDRTLPELTFDREYWRIEIFTYWAPTVVPPKPALEKDYVKIEVYEAGTNKLIHTITSGNEESSHKFQTFRKPGKYYLKVYSKSPSQWEIAFTVSSKIAQ